MRLRNAEAVFLLAALPLWAAPPQRKESECATCHREQAHSQPLTSMGQALEEPGVRKLLQAHPKLEFRQGDFVYRVETTGDRSTYTVGDGKNQIAVPIKWAFGTKSQTFVLERDGHRYESMVSYYPAIDGLDITMGDQAIHPRTLSEAFGREIADPETEACFTCHATGAVQQGKLQLDSLKPGVRCDHCHTGVEKHFQAITHGDAKSIPPQLGKLSAEEISNFCGQCHRTWESVVRGRLRGETNVRFQPYRLANSKCYDGSDARLSCVACHDPHREVVRGAASYDAKCVTCHAAAPTSHSAAVTAKTCPVAKSGCTDCHMPKIPLPGGHQMFTDHQIRVVRAGEPYPN